jgi:hypothetical protein
MTMNAHSTVHSAAAPLTATEPRMNLAGPSAHRAAARGGARHGEAWGDMGRHGEKFFDPVKKRTPGRNFRVK